MKFTYWVIMYIDSRQFFYITEHHQFHAKAIQPDYAIHFKDKNEAEKVIDSLKLIGVKPMLVSIFVTEY